MVFKVSTCLISENSIKLEKKKSIKTFIFVPETCSFSNFDLSGFELIYQSALIQNWNKKTSNSKASSSLS